MWRALKTFTFWAAVIATICVVAQLLSVEAQIWFYDVYNGLLIQLILIAIVIDAVRFKVFRFLLVFPLVFYGGYYYVYFQEGQLLDSYVTHIREHNESLNLSFDPDLYALTINAPDKFVANYKVDVAYEFGRGIPRTLAESSRMLDKENCAKYEKLTDNARILRIQKMVDSSIDNGRCIITLVEFPKKKTFMINSGAMFLTGENVYFDNIDKKVIPYKEIEPELTLVQEPFGKFSDRNQATILKYLKISIQRGWGIGGAYIFSNQTRQQYRYVNVWKMHSYPLLNIGCDHVPIAIADVRVPLKRVCNIVIKTMGRQSLNENEIVANIIDVEQYTDQELREFKASEQVLAEIDSIIAMP